MWLKDKDGNYLNPLHIASIAVYGNVVKACLSDRRNVAILHSGTEASAAAYMAWLGAKLGVASNTNKEDNTMTLREILEDAGASELLIGTIQKELKRISQMEGELFKEFAIHDIRIASELAGQCYPTKQEVSE